nr:carbohydrate-binding protein [Lachnospiraceae bacterium]
CLVADLFGDYREELVLRTKDDSAIRIYINTDISTHKLYTLMQDSMYRVGVAWQNNCYNQPCYTKFYYGSDMDFEDVLNV